MKFLFIPILLWASFKLFVLKDVKNKIAYVVFCLSAVLLGVINMIFEFSFADILKRWM